MRKELWVTVRQGGLWYPIDCATPPYAAILYPDGRIWDCLLRAWRGQGTGEPATDGVRTI